ncbi:MAG: hypothetical protein ACRD2R_06200 [Terriglobales bacterium]
MSPLTILGIVWAAITVILVLLLIYRSTLTMHEDDQLFINESESHMAKEQEELLQKMDKLQPFVRGLGAASGVLAVLMFGLWIWRGINQM